jgi:hypothetical protein
VIYEDIYLHAYETVRELKVALASHFSFYNGRRPHQSLEDRTPARGPDRGHVCLGSGGRPLGLPRVRS